MIRVVNYKDIVIKQIYHVEGVDRFNGGASKCTQTADRFNGGASW